MPGYDGTGPVGLGSRTGGGFGFCPGTARGNLPSGRVSGFGDRVTRPGRYSGKPFARRQRRFWHEPGSGLVQTEKTETASDALTSLAAQAERIEATLTAMEKRIMALEKLRENKSAAAKNDMR